MVPAERGEVLEQALVYGIPMCSERLHRPLQVDCIPEHDRGDHQVEPRGAVLLVLEAPVPQLPQPVEEDRTRQRIPCLTLVEPHMHPPPQLRAP
jgi:hypothetical protein